MQIHDAARLQEDFLNNPRGRVPAALATFFFLMIPFAVEAEVVTLPSVQDNTLYETEDGSLSNGAGQHFFVG